MRRMAAIGMFGLMLAAACSSTKPTGQASSSPTPTKQTPTPVQTNLPPYNPTIDPAKFTSHITNKYFPLTPGKTYIYEGSRDGTPRRTEMTITKETKVIMGVTCVVVRDVLTQGNALVEKTVDWYAQDADGNVWYFGEDTKEYTNGAVSSTAGTWTGGVDGALPGIIMEAKPKLGDSYRQEYRPGIAEDFAKVEQLNATRDASGKTYKQVVVTRDTDLLDASKDEHKFFAPGVGFIGSDGMVNGHHEINNLSQVLSS